MPSYAPEPASNPFITFAAIPAESRYRFLLDEAEFFIMNFIKGPVCRGQMAVDVIDDRFWVYFLDPEAETAAAALSRDADALGAVLAGIADDGGIAALADASADAIVLRTLAESFRNYGVVARREAELRSELGRMAAPGPEVVVRVPSLDTDISDLAGLMRIGEVLFTGTIRP